MRKNLIFALILLIAFPVFSQKPTYGFDVDLSEKKDKEIFSKREVAGKSFTIKGTKGYFWTPEQYMAEIPTLKSFGMNFIAT